jgi:energy-converting hydrogenase Eha subunit C
MSRTVKKKISSMSYSLNGLYRKISTMKPSTLILSIITIAIAIFLFGGGVYDLTVKPYPAVYSQGRFILVNPYLSEQFIADSIAAIILYSLGTVGLIAIYQSTKYAYKPRQAYMMFAVGTVLLLLAYIFLEVEIKIKTG